MPKQSMRKEVELFSQYMEHKLKLNDHKGGWEEVSLPQLLFLLEKEVDELKKALHEEPDLNIVFEAADIANFAMMIAWNVMRSAFGSTQVETSGYIQHGEIIPPEDPDRALYADTVRAPHDPAEDRPHFLNTTREETPQCSNEKSGTLPSSQDGASSDAFDGNQSPNIPST